MCHVLILISDVANKNDCLLLLVGLMHIVPALFSALWAVLSIKHNASIMQALKRIFEALCRAGKFTLARLILVIGLWY